MANQNIPGSLKVTGNVGIGVEPDNNAQLYIKSSTSLGQIFLENSDGALLKLTVDDNRACLGADSEIPLDILTNNTPRISITDTGNVGIGMTGTARPRAKLEISGDLKLQYGVSVNEFSNDSALNNNSDLAVPTEKAVKTYVDGEIGQVNTTLATKAEKTYVDGEIGKVNTALAAKAEKTYVDNKIDEVNATKAELNGSDIQDFKAKTLTVQDTLQANKLQVSGGGAIAGPLTFQNDLKVLGNFEVDGTTTFRNIEQHQGDIELGNEDTDEVRIHGVLRSTHSSVALKISSAVDIGASATPANLKVNGSVHATTFYGNGENLSGLMRKAGDTLTGPLTINDSLTVWGNVGIGTTTPTAKLEVRGNLTLESSAPTLFTGTESSELNRYLHLLNSPEYGSASGLKVGGILVSDSYDYANPGKNDLIVKGNVGIGTTSSSNFKLNIGGTGGQNALHVASDFGLRGDNRLNLIRFGSDGDYQVLHKASGAFGRNTLAMHVHDDDAFGVYSSGWVPLLEIQGKTGDFYAKGNVGIGTTTPSAKLDVRGHLILEAGGNPLLWTGTGSSELNRYLELLNSPDHNSASGLKVGGILVSDSYAYANPGKNDLIVKGNVGIGTANPNHKFHVLASNEVGLFESSGTEAYLRLSTNEGINNRVEIANRPGGRLALWTAEGGDVLNITKNGNVGIGTTDIESMLHVAVGNSQYEDASLRISGKYPSLSLYDTSGNPNARNWAITAPWYQPGDFAIFQSNESGGDPRNAGTRRFYINRDGNVAIGTTSSSNFKLNIGGTGGQNALHVTSDFGLRGDNRLNLIRFGSDGDYQVLHKASGAFGRNTLAMHVHDDDAFGVYSSGWVPLLEIQGKTGDFYAKGNVGIGTTTPSSKLDVRGHLILETDGNPTLFTGTGSSELNRYLRLETSPDYHSASGLKVGGILVSDSYDYANPGKNDLIVKGNVGIGTANPQAKLEVNGNISFNDVISTPGRMHVSGEERLYLLNKEGVIIGKERGGNGNLSVQGIFTVLQDSYLAVSGGNVGIGTTEPQGKLDVQGDIRAGNSDLYFTKTDHNHSEVGNANGYAAIENAADYGSLMILGRAGTSKGRYVRLWDYLQVNGGMDITGNVGIGTTTPSSKLDVSGNTTISGDLSVIGTGTLAGSLSIGGDVKAGGVIYAGGNPLAYENYEIYVRGSAMESTEGDTPTLKVANVSISMNTSRGLNTVILNPNGTFKEKTSHDVHGSVSRWNNWADWLNANAADGDLIAVASRDAINNAPTGGSAEKLLRQIVALQAFRAVKGHARSPYALLFVKGRSGAIEVSQSYKGANAHLKTTYYQLLNYGDSAVMVGMIVMWSGAVADIPSGWALCNGQNGTPDLRDRFIVAGGGSYNPGDSGNPDAHSHTVKPPPTEIKLTIKKDGKHTHKFPDAWYDRSFREGNRTGIDICGHNIDAETTQSQDSHDHKGSTSTVKIAQFDSGSSSGLNRPKWYALCFIMKL